MKLTLAISIALLGLVACSTPGTRKLVPIGTARASADFATYDIRRVGVLPPRGEELDPELANALRDALRSSFASETHYEIVPIGAVELESLDIPEPTRTGRTQPRQVLELARRSGLDALIVTRVVDFRPYEPVRLGLEVDLIAIDTGLVTWTAQVRVDVGNRATVEVIEVWQDVLRAGGDSEHAVDLLSPRRIAEFAAAQVAMLL